MLQPQNVCLINFNVNITQMQLGLNHSHNIFEIFMNYSLNIKIPLIS